MKRPCCCCVGRVVSGGNPRSLARRGRLSRLLQFKHNGGYLYRFQNSNNENNTKSCKKKSEQIKSKPKKKKNNSNKRRMSNERSEIRKKEKGDNIGGTIKRQDSEWKRRTIARMAIDLRFRLRLNVIGMDENRGRERERERECNGEWKWRESNWWGTWGENVDTKKKRGVRAVSWKELLKFELERRMLGDAWRK